MKKNFNLFEFLQKKEEYATIKEILYYHMTKREKELLEEVSILKDKLDHAQKWMNRQVQETSTSNKGFFERLKKKPSLFEHMLRFVYKVNIVDIIHRIRKFHLFHRHYSFVEIWKKRFEAFFV